MKKLSVRTVILSDVHLGTPESKVREVNHFLRHVRCSKLILNGDIIDGWQLRRKGQWTKAHTRFIRIVLKKLEKRGTRGRLPARQPRRRPGALPAARLRESLDRRGAHPRRARAAATWCCTAMSSTRSPGILSSSPTSGDWGYHAAAEDQPALQRLAGLARPRVLVPQQGDQGAGEGGGEPRLELRGPHRRAWRASAAASG